jgi:hypothetical protein
MTVLPMRAASLALAMCLLAGPAAAQSRPHATVLPRSLDAFDAVARDGMLFVLEPDQRALAAYRLPSVTLAWRTTLPDATASGSQLTALEPGRLLVWNAGRIYVVSRARGTIESRQSYSPNARPFLWRHGDACGLNLECTFQPIDCTDARALGPPIGGMTMEFFDHDPGPSSGCFGFERTLVGATATTAVYVFAGTSDGHDTAVVGIDRAGGAVRYRAADIACAHCTAQGAGAVPAGDVCWTVDDSHEIEVRAFTCSTGHVMWRWHTRGLVSTVTTSTLGGAAPAVLFSISPSSATLLDARTGAVRWTRPIGASTLALVEGGHSDAELTRIYGYDSILTLDASTGATRSTITIPHGGHVGWQPDGTFRVYDGEVPGETGGPTAPAPRHDPVLRVDRGTAGTRARVVVRATGVTALTLSNDGWWIGEELDGRDVVVAVFEWLQHATGHVRFVRVVMP